MFIVKNCWFNTNPYNKYRKILLNIKALSLVVMAQFETIRAFWQVMSLSSTRYLLGLVVLLLLVGTFIFMEIEKSQGLTALDWSYFCVVSLLTIGYGDIAPQTEMGRAIAIIYLVVGVGILLGFVQIIFSQTIKTRLEMHENDKSRSERSLIRSATADAIRHAECVIKSNSRRPVNAIRRKKNQGEVKKNKE